MSVRGRKPETLSKQGVTKPEYKEPQGDVKNLRIYDSQLVWVAPNRNDAARDSGFDVQGAGPGDQFVAFSTWVQPDLRNLLARDLLDHSLADFGRYVERGHVDWPRHVEH